MSAQIVSGIYQIRNAGKVYVGSAADVAKRWRLHRSLLNRCMHHSILLQRAWNKYGEGAFSFEIVEVVERKELLVPREQHHLDAALATGQHYNYSPTAGSMLGHKHTEVTRAKMSLAKKGKPLSPAICAERSLRMKGTPLAAGHCANMRLAPNARMEGKTHSAETREKMSVKAKLRGPKSAETRAKLSAANKGKTLSAETRARIGAASRGNTHNVGRKHSSETRAKVSAALMGNTHTTGGVLFREHRAHISLGLKRWNNSKSMSE